MTKVLIIFILSLLCLRVFAQEEDSTYYEDDFIKDTTSTFHIGFSLGVIAQAMFYTGNENSIYGDSISFSRSIPNGGFSIGVMVERDFSSKIWLRTGLNINISKMNISYVYKENLINYNYNYSTLEIPLWLQYAFKTKQRGLSWGAEVKPSFDISHAVDYNNRLFEIRKTTLLLGSGPSMRWQLPSGNWLNFSLGFNIGILNVFKDVDNIYNNSIKSGRPWQIQMLISLD